MTRPALFITAKTLEALALCLWLGGMVAVGAFVAPVAFAELARADAGRVMGECFRRLNSAGIACGGVLLLTLVLEGIAVPSSPPRLRAARAALAGGALALSLYLTFSLFPEMEAQRASAGPGPAPEGFAALHALSRRLLSFQMLLLLGALIASAASSAGMCEQRSTESTEVEHGEPGRKAESLR
jgi:hypothetical protein